MSINKLSALFASAILFFISCEEYNQKVHYPAAEPKSDIAKQLVEKTNYIYSIYNDVSYKIHPAVEVTELAYLNNEGRSMRTFWYKIDLTNPEISLECILPNNGQGALGSSEELSSMLSHVDTEKHKVLGGVNSDFGGGAGPQGVFWMKGEIIKNNFIPLIDRPRCFVSISDEKTVEIKTEAEYSDYVQTNGDKMSEVFCGSPRLIVDGRIDIAVPNDLDTESHPRTVIGVMEDKTTVYFMVVDGRRYTYSNGMYLNTIAEMFKALGCHNALNLDGGGSSTFIVAQEGEFGDSKRMVVKNWPNDGGGVERKLCNGLAIIANTK